MRAYYEKASRKSAVTGEELIRQLETRLDAVILRLGFALTQRQARQLVCHGHVTLERPAAWTSRARRSSPRQTIEISDKAKNFVCGARGDRRSRPTRRPTSIGTRTQLPGTMSRVPERDEIPLPVPIEERLIVEFYS